MDSSVLLIYYTQLWRTSFVCFFTHNYKSIISLGILENVNFLKPKECRNKNTNKLDYLGKAETEKAGCVYITWQYRKCPVIKSIKDVGGWCEEKKREMWLHVRKPNSFQHPDWPSVVHPHTHSYTTPNTYRHTKSNLSARTHTHTHPYRMWS